MAHDEDGTLPNEVLHQIVSERNYGKVEKTGKILPRGDYTPGSVRNTPPGQPRRQPDYVTDEDNLRKVMARRSQCEPIIEGDLHTGNNQEEVTIEFAPQEENDGFPGAYSGAPGADYGRIEKTPLPQQLRGDATQRDNSISNKKEDDNPPGEKEPAQEWSFQEVDQAESVNRKKRGRRLLASMGIFILLLTIILPTVLLLGGGKDGEEEVLATPVRPIPAAEKTL